MLYTGPGISKSSRQGKVEPLCGADDTGSALLFVTHSNGARLKREDQARVYSHVRTRKYILQKKERAVFETRRKCAVELHPAPGIDVLLGMGSFDTFNVFPVKMSSSDRRVLDYCNYSLYR